MLSSTNVFQDEVAEPPPSSIEPSAALAGRAGVQPGEPAAAGAAEENRLLVARRLAEAAGQTRQTTPKACGLLVAAAFGAPSGAALLSPADRRAVGWSRLADGVGRQARVSEEWAGRAAVLGFRIFTRPPRETLHSRTWPEHPILAKVSLRHQTARKSKWKSWIHSHHAE